MMDEKKLDKLYLEDNYNCAETTLRAVNDSFHLGLDDEALKLVGGFGGGMGCGRSCGVLCASLAAISAVMIKEKAHEDPGIRNACAHYVLLFEKELGSTECNELKEKYFKADGTRCKETVAKGLALLEDYLKEVDRR